METSLTIDYDEKWLNCVCAIGPNFLYFDFSKVLLKDVFTNSRLDLKTNSLGFFSDSYDIDGGTITFKSISTSDAGRYQCIAENSYGHISSSADLKPTPGTLNKQTKNPIYSECELV